MREIFIFTGMMTFGMVLIFALYLIIVGIKEIVSSVIYRYKYKHRFDKKPTAKCYCIDCRYYEDGYVPKQHCSVFGRCMRDDQFCSIGIPKKQPNKED